MKKAVIAASVATMLSASVQADTLLGLYVGGSVWDTETSGSFGDVNAQDEFTFKDEENASFFVALEHPIPFIPNVKVASTDLTTKGSSALVNGFTLNEVPFASDSTVVTDFDVSFIDYTLYFELLDNDLLTLDIGVTGRDFDGEAYLETAGASVGGAVSSNQELTEMVPMLYASTIVGLPFTGFSVFAEGNLSFGDHTVYDYQAGVSYALLDNLAVDLNINAGYRLSKMEFDDLDGLSSDLDFEGVFLGATVHF